MKHKVVLIFILTACNTPKEKGKYFKIQQSGINKTVSFTEGQIGHQMKKAE